MLHAQAKKRDREPVAQACVPLGVGADERLVLLGAGRLERAEVRAVLVCAMEREREFITPGSIDRAVHHPNPTDLVMSSQEREVRTAASSEYISPALSFWQ